MNRAPAWRTITLDVPNRKYRTPRVFEQKVRPRERTFRQFFITDLGHEEPTILLTNDMTSKAAAIIARYAKRMLIENALSDAVRFFHIDALSSSVGFKIDFDMALLVLASGLYRLMARRMRGYDDAQARQIYLRELYGDSLPSCSCVMWVDPRGFAASSRKPWGAARTGLVK